MEAVPQWVRELSVGEPADRPIGGAWQPFVDQEIQGAAAVPPPWAPMNPDPEPRGSLLRPFALAAREGHWVPVPGATAQELELTDPERDGRSADPVG
jgi:hypothetical protein